MNDFILVEIIVGLFFVIIAEFFFLDSQLKRAQEEKKSLLEDNSRLVKAIMAKNANEYVMTAAIDKVPKEEQPEPEPDAVLEEQLSNEEWLEAIDKQTKAAQSK